MHARHIPDTNTPIHPSQIWALVEGHVKFMYSRMDKHQYVSVVPPLKFGQVCEHKALEAKSFKQLNRSIGYVGLAQYAYSKAGLEGASKLEKLMQIRDKVRKELCKAWKARREARKQGRLLAATASA
jgi:hypothetical protein